MDNDPYDTFDGLGTVLIGFALGTVGLWCLAYAGWL